MMSDAIVEGYYGIDLPFRDYHEAVTVVTEAGESQPHDYLIVILLGCSMS